MTTKFTGKLTQREAKKLARKFGLKQGYGTYNGGKFWLQPGTHRIVTRERLAEIAGLLPEFNDFPEEC